MKKIIVLFALIGLAVFLSLSCDNDDSTAAIDPIDNSEEINQMMYLYSYYQRDYWDDDGNIVNIPNSDLSGMILGDPLPELEYVTVNDTTFSDITALYYMGYTRFGCFG